MRFRSLKTRVLVWFGSIVALLLVLFSISFYYFYNESINLSIETKLYNHALYIHDKILPTIEKNKIIQNDRFASIQIAIIKDNQIINQTKAFVLGDFRKFINQKKSFIKINGKEHLNALYNFIFKEPFSGHILLYQTGIDDKAENVVDTLLVLDPILLIVLLMLGSRLIEKILVPIKSVTNIAQNISVTNFSKKIPLPKGDYEIIDLVNSFNEMIERLKDGFDKIDRFNSDVSHELKTPLTVIKGEIEVSLKKRRSVAYYQQSLSAISDAANQIQHIISDLLFLTKFSKKNIKATYKQCDLDLLLLAIIEKYAPLAKKRNIKIHVERLEPIMAEVNPLLIERVFSNLLDNAIKYTHDEKNIYISLYHDKKIHFIIKDEGIGIPEAKISKVTDRFFRVDESRSKSIDGFGIGLSIVENCVALHDGTLNITSKENEGTIVEVTL